MSARATAPLDDAVHAVRAQLAERGVPAPELLVLAGTGLGEWPEELRHAREAPLAELEGVPAPWDACVLHAGRLGRLSAWLLEDRSDEPGTGEEPPWAGGFPLWLAGAAGCGICVHVSAGTLLGRAGPESAGRIAGEGAGEGAPGGAIALVRDHLNASGGSPLVGLAGSALGPLFPDLTGLHHLGLRRAALERARRLGVPAFEAVAACTLGPAIETPAERRMLAALGAEVAVQSLATPLLAAAHAGISVLALVAVLDDGGGPADVPDLLEAARVAEPRVRGLVLALLDDLARAARSRAQELGR